LRLLARRKVKARFAIDDWLIVATLVPSYAMLIVGSLSKFTYEKDLRERC
jgi:hypothetical protein